jgi:hypothetical protein
MQRLVIAMATLGAAALAQASVASEYCVVCAGPDATYRCQVGGVAPTGRETDPRLQLLCISEIAKSGAHDSCSIDRKATSAGAGEACPGELRVIAAPIGPPPGATPAAVDAPGLPPGDPSLGPQGEPHIDPADPAAEAAPQKDKVPQTMEELAGQTVKNSKENLQKAGDAIGGTGNAIAGGAKQAGEKIGDAGSAVGTAAKKTWNCLASLFNDC